MSIFNFLFPEQAQAMHLREIAEASNDMFSANFSDNIRENENKQQIGGLERRVKKLEEDNIESRPLWKPMHLQPLFEQYPAYTNGVSEDLFEKGLCLPSDSKMTEEDIQRVIRIIRNLFS